jgi:hypothetical protein
MLSPKVGPLVAQERPVCQGGTIMEALVVSALESLGGSIAKSAATSLIGDVLNGNANVTAEELGEISDQLSAIATDLNAIAPTTVFLEDVSNAQKAISGVAKALQSLPLDAATQTQFVDFLSIGNLATDYWSLGDTLMQDTYGLGFDDCVGDPTALAYGTATGCEAYALNNSLLAANPTITAYINGHLNLASTVASLVAGLCAAAYAAYNALPTALQGTVTVTLAEISALPQQMAPYIYAAPQVICGQAFTIYNSLFNEGSSLQVQVVSESLGGSNYIGIGSTQYNAGSPLAYYSLQFASGSQYWTMSFSDLQSGQVCFAGPGGSYLALSAEAGLDPSLAEYTPPVPALAASVVASPNSACYWNLLMANNNNATFILTNVGSQGQALANNHIEILESPTPGSYGYQSSDPDEYWNIVIKTS